MQPWRRGRWSVIVWSPWTHSEMHKSVCARWMSKRLDVPIADFGLAVTWPNETPVCGYRAKSQNNASMSWVQTCAVHATLLRCTRTGLWRTCLPTASAFIQEPRIGRKYYSNVWIFTDLVGSAKFNHFVWTSSSTAFVSCWLCLGNHAPRITNLRSNLIFLFANLALPVFAKMPSDAQMLRDASLVILIQGRVHIFAQT